MPEQNGHDLVCEVRLREQHALKLRAVALTADVHDADQGKKIVRGTRRRGPTYATLAAAAESGSFQKRRNLSGSSGPDDGLILSA